MNPWADPVDTGRILDVNDYPDDGRPFLLIDVDGVLNAINNNQGDRTYNIFKVGPYTIRLRHELREWLDRLGDHFRPVWATMWDDDANVELAWRLGLPDLPYIPCARSQFEVALWNGVRVHSKVPCIKAHLADRSFAWIDDTIGGNDLEWAAHRDDEIAPTYLLKIDPRMGLLEHHVDKLVKWAEKIK